MEIDQKCKEVQERYGWSQRRLADEIGMTEPNLISARKGRRPMPAHALAKVERLRGVDDASIVDQIIRTAACVALAVVLLFGTGAENRAIASDTYAAQTGGNTNYRVFWRRWMRAAGRTISRVLQGIAELASPPRSAGSIVCAR